MKSIKAHLQHRKPGGGLLGAELAELTKAATAKNVAQPDEELMLAVTTAVNSSSESSAAQQMRDILHKRLTVKNPHKVWLATVLTDKVLKDCADVIAPVRSDLFQDLADIAGKPLDRYQENFKDEQRAKMHAFGVLRSSGRQAQSILRHTCKIGRMVNLTAPETKSQRKTRKEDATGSQPSSRPANAAESGADLDSSRTQKMTWEQVKAAIETSLGVAGSHTQMIQDLVVNITSGQSAAPDFERQFLGELVEEVLSFRAAFEQLLASFSTFKQDTAPLVKKSLEAIEEMNNVLELYRTQVAETGGSISAAHPVAVRSASFTASQARSTAARGGASITAAPTLAARRSRSGPLDDMKAVGEALPAGSSSSGTRQDKDRSRRDGSTTHPHVKLLQSSEGPTPQQHRGGYRSPDLMAQQTIPLATTHLQNAPSTQQQQMSFNQALPQTMMPQASFYPQQQLQHQGSGSSGGLVSQMSANRGAMSSGFIPMSQSMQGYQGGAPVLYMPVVGPDGQQGFAPVFQQPQQTQQFQQFQQLAPQTMFPSGGSSLDQQGQAQQQQQQQPNFDAFARAGTFQQGAPVTHSNPYVQGPSMMQPSGIAAAPTRSAPGILATAAEPLRNASQVRNEANTAPTLRSPTQKPLPAVRHRQPATAADPFSDLGQLDAPYTPAAFAASSTGFGAPAKSNATAYDSGRAVLPGAPLPSLEHSQIVRTEAPAPSTKGQGTAPAAVASTIPHCDSATSDIFPADSANGVLASTGLSSFLPPSASSEATSGV